MCYVAAYMLAVLGGNEKPTRDNIKQILASVGIEADDVRLNQVIGQLKDKNMNTLIASGTERLATVSVAGGAPSKAPEAEVVPQVEEKKETKVETDSSDEDFGLDLFG